MLSQPLAVLDELRACDSPSAAALAPIPGRRRGTTAMEYLMVLSLIIVVALAGIGYFGSMTGTMTQATSNAINKSLKKSE